MFLYGTPKAIAVALAEELVLHEFWIDIGVTAAEVAIGFVLGNATGVGLALVLWRLAPVGRIAAPYIVALGSIPVFAIAPLFILWFGIGFAGKLAVVVFSTTFVALCYCFVAAGTLEQTYGELIAAMGGSRSDLLWKVIAPGTLARGVVAFRTNVGFALIGVYVAEWISSRHGLGRFVLRASGLYDVPRVYAGLIVFIFMAFLMNLAISRFASLLPAGSVAANDEPI
jgi:NitT/TauT family transport system permease protein